MSQVMWVFIAGMLTAPAGVTLWAGALWLARWAGEATVWTVTRLNDADSDQRAVYGAIMATSTQVTGFAAGRFAVMLAFGTPEEKRVPAYEALRDVLREPLPTIDLFDWKDDA